MGLWACLREGFSESLTSRGPEGWVGLGKEALVCMCVSVHVHACPWVCVPMWIKTVLGGGKIISPKPRNKHGCGTFKKGQNVSVFNFIRRVWGLGGFPGSSNCQAGLEWWVGDSEPNKGGRKAGLSQQSHSLNQGTEEGKCLVPPGKLTTNSSARPENRLRGKRKGQREVGRWQESQVCHSLALWPWMS